MDRSDVSQIEIVTLAVYLLGGISHAVDTEDIAVKASELAPGRLTWRKYPDQINLELVRVYLSDAKKAEKGAYLTGSGRIGWSLTSKGRSWAKTAAESLDLGNLGRPLEEAMSGSVDARRADRERRRIRLTEAWVRWNETGVPPSMADAKEVFRIDHYATERMQHLKVNRLLELIGKDPRMGSFLAESAKVLGRRDGLHERE